MLAIIPPMISKDQAVKIAGMVALVGLYFVFSYPSNISFFSRFLTGFLIAGGWLVLYWHPKSDFVLTRRRIALVLCYIITTAGFMLLMIPGFSSVIAAPAIFIAIVAGILVLLIDWNSRVAKSWESLFRAGGFQGLSLWKKILVIAVFLAGIFLIYPGSFQSKLDPFLSLGLALLGAVLAIGSLFLTLFLSSGKKAKGSRGRKRI